MTRRGIGCQARRHSGEGRKPRQAAGLKRLPAVDGRRRDHDAVKCERLPSRHPRPRA
jgi:hypothetical protein